MDFPPEDERIWLLTNSGDYSTKIGYIIALQHQQKDICSVTNDQERFCRLLWRLNIMPKLKIFIWKLWQNCLPIAANLACRGLCDPEECSICLEGKEDNQHLFRLCPLALEVWDVQLSLLRSQAASIQSYSDWLIHNFLTFVIKEGLQNAAHPGFFGTLWAIWKTRNSQIFDNSRATMEELYAHVELGQAQHQLFIEKPIQPTRPSLLAGPPPGYHYVTFGLFSEEAIDILIRSDDSWEKDSHNAVAAWVANINYSEY